MDDREVSTIASSSEVLTPPPPHGAKRGYSNGAMGRRYERDGSEAIDAESLSKALQDFKDGERSREKTPTGSPSRKRQRIYGDRYVIASLTSNDSYLEPKRNSPSRCFGRLYFILDSFRIEMAKIYNRASVYSMTKHLLTHLPSQSAGQPTENFIFRRVSATTSYQTDMLIIHSGRSKPNVFEITPLRTFRHHHPAAHTSFLVP